MEELWHCNELHPPNCLLVSSISNIPEDPDEKRFTAKNIEHIDPVDDARKQRMSSRSSFTGKICGAE